MNRKLLIAYGLLILFILLGYLLVFNINKFADESRIRDYSDIKKENKLRVAVLNDVFCSGISDEENEKIYEFFRSLHTKDIPEVEISSYNNKIDALKDLLKNRVDVVAASIPVTTDYENHFEFTVPVATDRLMLVQRAAINNPGFITETIGLENKCVDIAPLPSIKLRMINFCQEIGRDVYIEEHEGVSVSRMVEMVSDSTVSYTICNRHLAEKLSPFYPDIDYSLPIGFTYNVAWAVRKNSPVLLDSLNNWIVGNQIFSHK